MENGARGPNGPSATPQIAVGASKLAPGLAMTPNQLTEVPVAKARPSKKNVAYTSVRLNTVNGLLGNLGPRVAPNVVSSANEPAQILLQPTAVVDVKAMTPTVKPAKAHHATLNLAQSYCTAASPFKINLTMGRKRKGRFLPPTSP